MLPTFVIGLREGVEAALIVGIIAAFLRQEGRRDALRWMWVGVAIAAAICVAVGVALELVSRDLPQRQQEMLETVVGADRRRGGHVHDRLDAPQRARAAAGARGSRVRRARGGLGDRARRDGVLRRDPRGLRDLGLPARRLRLVDATRSRPAAARCSASSLAVGIGYGIYRGGIRLNLARFFRVTGRRARAGRGRPRRDRRCTPRTRPAGSTASRARPSTCAGSSRPAPCARRS